MTDINRARRKAGLPEAPTAEQPTMPWADGLGQEDREVEAALRAFGHRRAEPQAMREMTPDEIRAAELAMLLDFVQGDPIDGAPSQDEVIAGIKHRISELTPETVQAEQPSPLARISGAITSEARELGPIERMGFLSGLIEAITALVREQTGEDVVGWVRNGETVPELPEIPTEGIRVFFHHDDGLTEDVTDRIKDGVDQAIGDFAEKLDKIEDRVILPAAVEFLNDHGAFIDEQIRGELATVVAARIAERLAR